MELFQLDDNGGRLQAVARLGGRPGKNALERVRERRPGALFNETFAEYLESRK